MRAGTRHPSVPHRPLVVLAVAACVLTGVPPAVGAQAWRVSSGDVEVRCRLTVGGSFHVETTALSGTVEPSRTGGAALTGTLRVDLTTLDSGIDLRNAHLRDTYLEVARGAAFQVAVLSEIALADPLPATGRQETAFSGLLALHGVERPVAGTAALRHRDGQLDVEARFAVSLDEFDIPPPRYLGIGVRDTVDITVTFTAMRPPVSPAETP